MPERCLSEASRAIGESGETIGGMSRSTGETSDTTATTFSANRRDLHRDRFDDLACASDNQSLVLPNRDSVTVRVTKGKVIVAVKHSKHKPRAA